MIGAGGGGGLRLRQELGKREPGSSGEGKLGQGCAGSSQAFRLETWAHTGPSSLHFVGPFVPLPIVVASSSATAPP